MLWMQNKRRRPAHYVAILLGGLVFLRACPVVGQPTSSNDDQDPVAVLVGEPAPFAGDLWPPLRSLRMALRAETCAERAAIDLRHEARKFQIELKHEKDTADLRRQADQERIAILMAALDEGVPWYESPAFVAVVASAATVAAILVATVVIDAALVP